MGPGVENVGCSAGNESIHLHILWLETRCTVFHDGGEAVDLGVHKLTADSFQSHSSKQSNMSDRKNRVHEYKSTFLILWFHDGFLPELRTFPII